MLKHVFIISVHKGYQQIQLLLNSLQFGEVFLHVDAKADDVYSNLVDYSHNHGHVQVIEERIDVNWSGFSQVKATLALLKAVKESGINFDYIHYISGQDLLLMNASQVDAFIQKVGYGLEFIDYEDIGKYYWRIKCYSLFRENKKNRSVLYRGTDIALRILQIPFLRRKNLHNYQLYKGSSWFSLTQDCAFYILEEGTKHEFIKQFSYTACPDEHFFQILIMNSKFKDRVYNNHFRYIEFGNLKSSPSILTMSEKDKFLTGDYIFARKFDMDVDQTIILEILASIHEIHASM